MRAWQIFAVGVAVLVLALLLPSYEPLLAGMAAVVMVAVVVGQVEHAFHEVAVHERGTHP